MDINNRIGSTSPGNDFTNQISPNYQTFADLNSPKQQQKWDDSAILDYNMDNEPSLMGYKYDQPSGSASSLACGAEDQLKVLSQVDGQLNAILQTSKNQDWDPRLMLNNLSLLEEKIHQLQDLVHLIVGRRGQVLERSDELVAQQQQLVTADLTLIIVQLISTAGSLLPSVKNTLASANPSVCQLNEVLFSSGRGLNSGNNLNIPQNNQDDVSNQTNRIDLTNSHVSEQNYAIDDHELKDEDEVDDHEHLPPGSYEILQLEKEEILAPHTHFCTICGKGFKRDANLRMHMRGHGDEYKSPAALAKPYKESSSEPILIKRYSCPFFGCKRNKDHKKFQPLKTILCVKNHYKRSHCDKSHICSRCNTKKFSVIADLKTHEKHCGRDRWLCSCGTTFSRKDKLFGHISLFQGHTPAILLDEKVAHRVESSKMEQIGFNFDSDALTRSEMMQNVVDVKGDAVNSSAYFSPLPFDTSNLNGFHEFPRQPFDDSVSSFSFLMPGSRNYLHKTEGHLDSNDQQ